MSSLRAYRERLKAQGAARASEDVGPAPLTSNPPIPVSPSSSLNPTQPANFGAPTLPSTQLPFSQSQIRPSGRSLANFMHRTAGSRPALPPSTTALPSTRQAAHGEEESTHDRRFRKPNAAVDELISKHKSPHATTAADKLASSSPINTSSSPLHLYTVSRAGGKSSDSGSGKANGTDSSLSPGLNKNGRTVAEAQQHGSVVVVADKTSPTERKQRRGSALVKGAAAKKCGPSKSEIALNGKKPAVKKKVQPFAAREEGIPVRKRKRGKNLIIDDSASEEESYHVGKESADKFENEDNSDSDIELSLEEESEEEEEEQQALGRRRTRGKPITRNSRAKVARREFRGTADRQKLLSLDDLLIAQEEELNSNDPSSPAAAATGAVAPAAVPPLAGDQQMTLLLDQYGRELPEDTPDDDIYLEMRVPGSIAKYLRPYQRQGVKFLCENYARGRGALLADDMGLGKTLQSIAFLSAVLRKSGNPLQDKIPSHMQNPNRSRLEKIPPVPPGAAQGGGRMVAEDETYAPDYSTSAPVLIVCPSSLLDNWGNEFTRWGTFRVIKLRGKNVDSGLASIISGQNEVAIVSYNTLQTKVERMIQIPWHLVIFDEAHRLKNPKTLTAGAADILPTRLRYGLSGTPMANDYEELYCLMEILVPGSFGNEKKFTTEISKPIKMGLRSDSTDEEVAKVRLDS